MPNTKRHQPRTRALGVPLTLSRFYVVRYRGDTYAATHISEAVDAACIEGDPENATLGLVHATDAGAARLMRPRTWRDLSTYQQARVLRECYRD